MRKGLQTLTFPFDAESLTHFGGPFLIQRFCNKLELRRRLGRLHQPKRQVKWACLIGSLPFPAPANEEKAGSVNNHK